MQERRILGGKIDTLYNLVVTDNLNGVSNASSNATVTISYVLDGTTTTLGTTYKNGNSFLIPGGATDISVIGNDLTGTYDKRSFAPETSVNDTTYTVTYKAQKVTVYSNYTTNIRINKGDTSQLVTAAISYSTYVPWGSTWSVTSGARNGRYPSSISPSSGTANSTYVSVSITMTEFTLITTGAADLGNSVTVKWAAMNVGASSYTDAGSYFSWGDIIGHEYGSGYNFSNITYNRGTSGSGHNLNASFTSGDSTYDAASSIQGTPFRMPTLEEFNNLKNNTKLYWYTVNSVYGVIFVGTNNNAVFFPAGGYYNSGSTISSKNSCGYYWTINISSSSLAQSMFLSSGSLYKSNQYRYSGLTIRAIQSK